MPLYEYRCKQCERKFEKIQGYDAPEAMECPSCKGEALRMISRAAVQFKGSGFYSTDYGAKPSASEKSSEAVDTSSAGEAKPATDTTKAPSSTDGASAPSTAAPSTATPSTSSGSRAAPAAPPAAAAPKKD